MRAYIIGFTFISGLLITPAEAATMPMQISGQMTCSTARCWAGPGEVWVGPFPGTNYAQGFLPESADSYQIGIYAGPDAGNSSACFDTGGGRWCDDGVHTAMPGSGPNAGWAMVGPVYGGRVVWGPVTTFTRGNNGEIRLYELNVPRAVVHEGEQWCAVIKTNDGEIYSLTIDKDRRNKGSSFLYVGCSNAPPLPPTPVLNSCKVTTSSPINVAFGNVERSDITTTTGVSVSSSLGISCTGTTTHTFNVKLSMTQSNWSNKQIRTNNENLGVSLSAGGVTMASGSSFKMDVNGSDTKDLEFTLLRNPNVDSEEIKTGNFNSSATLIVTED